MSKPTKSVAQLYHQYVHKRAMLLVLAEPGCETRNARTGVWIAGTILNVKLAYGREHVLFAPLAGEGTAWVEASEKLRLIDEWPDFQVPAVDGSKLDAEPMAMEEESEEADASVGEEAEGEVP